MKKLNLNSKIIHTMDYLDMKHSNGGEPSIATCIAIAGAAIYVYENADDFAEGFKEGFENG